MIIILTFILYNNIDRLDNKLDEIHKLVPEATIRYAHGRMTKDHLENIMIDNNELEETINFNELVYEFN